MRRLDAGSLRPSGPRRNGPAPVVVMSRPHCYSCLPGPVLATRFPRLHDFPYRRVVRGRRRGARRLPSFGRIPAPALHRLQRHERLERRTGRPTSKAPTKRAIRPYAQHVKNLEIDSWNGLDFWPQQSNFKRLSSSLAIGNESWDSRGPTLENYTVGETRVGEWNDSWRASAIGRLNFDGELRDSWNVR